MTPGLWILATLLAVALIAWGVHRFVDRVNEYQEPELSDQYTTHMETREIHGEDGITLELRILRKDESGAVVRATDWRECVTEKYQ